MSLCVLPKTVTFASLAFLLGSALLPRSTRAQAAYPDSSLFGPHPAPFWALSVADIDRQVGWYRDTLGFALYSQGTQPGHRTRFALLRHGAVLLELLQIPDARPRSLAAPGTTDPSQIQGFFKGGMVVSDVAGLFNRLRARGVTIAFELTQPPGGPYRVFGISDPEGNLLQFFGK